MFDTPEEAALAYNKKSRELYGEDGKLNVIRSKSKTKAKQIALNISKYIVHKYFVG